MKRVLIVFANLNSVTGPPVALINMLNKLPAGFEYDLILTSRRDEEYKHLWDRIPAHINILPPLYQFSRFSKELMDELRANGMSDAAEVREKVRELNTRDGEDRFRNWEYLKRIVPEHSGYDIAIAYTEDIALNIVCDCVTVEMKIGWVHSDYKLSLDADSINKKRAYWHEMDKIVCVSRQNMHSFSECYEGLRNRLVTIYNTNDDDYIKRRAGEFYPEEYANAGNCVKIFTSGTVGFRKGTDFAISAVKKLVEEGYNIKWYIAGAIGLIESHRGDECVRQIKDACLENTIILLGQKSNPYPYFANCDIYVHPSRYEGLSVAIQEAKILCKPILVTNHSSVDEVIVDGETGIICDISADSLTEKLKMMLGNPVLCKRLSENLKKPQERQDITAELEKLFSI